MRAFVTALLGAFVLQLSFASSAHAKDPDRVEWAKEWPRVRVVEVVNVVGLTLASYLISAEWTPPSEPRWSGPILFDKAVRSALKGQTLSAQSTAGDMADYFYKIGTLAPYVVDVYAVALGVHQNADVALQMLLINIQSLGLSGVVTLASERVVARTRPYTQDCGPDGVVRDASGKPLLNTCDHVGDDASFYSGHAAATMTMAGTTCVHHQHLPLYGGGFPDLVPCLVMLGISGATGVGRIVADRHYASDVIVGWGFGFASGYVLPSLLHYGFKSDRPVGAVVGKSFGVVPIPQAYPGGAGLSFGGYF